MRYRGSLTIPAGTAEAAPATATLYLAAGVVSEVEVFFPAGQAGLTFLVIYREESQVWPTSPDANFQGDDTHITFSESYELMTEPFSVELRGWAPSATLDHTVFVEVSIHNREETPLSGYGPVALPEGF